MRSFYRACLQFIPTAYVPRLVRGIQAVGMNCKHAPVKIEIFSANLVVLSAIYRHDIDMNECR
ncbi:MAG: hypothetical protein A3F46_09540 [Legionellales bacterium RIFCSPHIGHO2_12_FULL_42_9]|nr:MAG: hypothetical protein A3F46_09540 [Legionellales bacterium RIFCSPHIGHO2_12_FULL_42_9]